MQKPKSIFSKSKPPPPTSPPPNDSIPFFHKILGTEKLETLSEPELTNESSITITKRSKSREKIKSETIPEKMPSSEFPGESSPHSTHQIIKSTHCMLIPFVREKQLLQFKDHVITKIWIDDYLGEFCLFDGKNRQLGISDHGCLVLQSNCFQTDTISTWFDAKKESSKMWKILTREYQVEETKGFPIQIVDQIYFQFAQAPLEVDIIPHLPVFYETLNVWNTKTLRIEH